MIRTRSLLAVCAIVAFGGMLACEGATTTLPVPGASARSTSTQPTLDAEIRASVNAAFPKGHATAILAKWDQTVRVVQMTPSSTLKGKNVPGAPGRTELTRTIDFMDKKGSEATSLAGELAAHIVARIALDMSLYVYGGPNTPVPVVAPNADVAFAIVQPNAAATTTIATPAFQAAVQFPPSSVSEPTVVVITPDTAYYPANCSGPLVTHLCQYPKFYRFNVFPDVKLNVPAKVQVCHVDSGTTRLPLANHNRFQVAHDKPANEADYSAGSTVVDGVELLATVVMNVTKCQEKGGTTYTPPPPSSFGARSNPFSELAMRVVDRLGRTARALFVPKEAFAIDVGAGGSAEIFSTFGVVDPDSKPDLAQSPLTSSTRFHATVSTVLAGAAVPLAAWDVTNLGSGTSGAFTSKVIVATDSALASVVDSVTLAGGAALVPGAKFSYAAQSVTAPTAPGTYYVGTKVVYAGTDSTTADDWAFTRVVVTSLNNNYSLSDGDSVYTSRGGGTGGLIPYNLNCPSQSVGVGFSGIAGNYFGRQSILQVQLKCAELLPDGSFGATSITSAAGQFWGGTSFNGTCSNGQVLVGGSGVAAGTGIYLVASLTGSCASVATVVLLGNPESPIGPFFVSGPLAYAAPFDLPCPRGYAVTGIQGTAGDILDNIGFRCTKISDVPPIS